LLAPRHTTERIPERNHDWLAAGSCEGHLQVTAVLNLSAELAKLIGDGAHDVSLHVGENEAGVEARGLGLQVGAPAKRFFIIEYVDEVRRGFKWMRTAPKPDTSVVKRVREGLTKWSRLRKARLYLERWPFK